MRVAIFITSLEGGGAERIMCTLANALATRGVETDLVLTRRTGPFLDLVQDEVEVIDLDARRPFLAVPGLVRYLNERKPQALLSALTHANLIAVAARQLAREPIRLVVSQRADSSIKPDLRREPLELFNYWAMGTGYGMADAVVAVSQGVADSLANVHGIPPDKIHVIYNAVETLPNQEPASVQHPWLTDERDSPLLLAAGRLTYQKGFDTLLRATRLVRDERHVRLAVLGVGEDEEYLRNLSKRLGLDADVIFPGFVADVGNWMRRADLFVLSSRYEGLPGVLLQAMAAGTPVVSTDCPSGPAEILENGAWGELVPVDDASALAAAIRKTFNEPNPPDVRIRAGNFDLKTMVDAYLDLLLGTSDVSGSWNSS